MKDARDRINVDLVAKSRYDFKPQRKGGEKDAEDKVGYDTDEADGFWSGFGG